MSSSKFPQQVSDLKILFPSLEKDIAEYYLTMNKGNYEKTVQQIMEEQEQEGKKKPASPRGQPSSSRGQPSSSSGLNSGDYMQGTIDLNDPRFKENVEKEAKEIDFDMWLNTMIHSNASQKAKNLKSKLATLFGKNNWSVIDPRGDGFCGLYAATIDYTSGTSKVMSRDTIIDSIVLGLEEYYKARKLHITMGIPLPNELKTGDFYMEFSEKDSMMISEENIRNETNKRALRKRLEILKTLPNIPGEAFLLLAYAYKRNFLILNYDDKSSDPYVLSWIPCYADVYKESGVILYPRESATSIMFNNLHYFLFHNSDIQLKKETIARILQGEWQTRRDARGVRKSRKSRKSRRPRKATTITKMKKQKSRKPKYSIKKIRQPNKRTKRY
jgi:CUE domain